MTRHLPLDLFQVDAFAQRMFEGNPAAVVPLEHWPDDALLQAIAAENNLSETAFFAPEGESYRLRWFTPRAEVDLCGHATLATAHVLFEHLGHAAEGIEFSSRSGPLRVKRENGGYCMDFPLVASTPVALPGDLIDGFCGCKPLEVLAGPDYLAVFESERDIRQLRIDPVALARLDRRGVIATAPGHELDFVSRCFFPKLGVEEDPVTGSAHCQMAPYWSARLGTGQLRARQLSQRGGSVDCRVKGERVELSGSATTYLIGQIHLNPEP
ncbi:MAG: PhzF family phenazine biosynthesis protein [Wenzhouxiangella sp.]